MVYVQVEAGLTG